MWVSGNLFSLKLTKTFCSDFIYILHCAKSVRIRSYSSLHLPPFGLNIQSEHGKDSEYRHFLRSVEYSGGPNNRPQLIVNFFFNFFKLRALTPTQLLFQPDLKSRLMFRLVLNNRKNVTNWWRHKKMCLKLIGHFLAIIPKVLLTKFR